MLTINSCLKVINLELPVERRRQEVSLWGGGGREEDFLCWPPRLTRSRECVSLEMSRRRWWVALEEEGGGGGGGGRRRVRKANRR